MIRLHLISFYIWVLLAACSSQDSMGSDKTDSNAKPSFGSTKASSREDSTNPAPAEPALVASSSYKRLSPKEEALFFGSPEDKPPKVLDAQLEINEGQHFMTSDEQHPYKFYNKLKDLGGAYVGVGTDQCYLFTGWMRPKLAWFADYDQLVVLLHKAYFALFEDASTYEKFVALWSERNGKRSVALLEAAYEGDADREDIVRVFKSYHEVVYWRLLRLQKALRKAKVPGFVTDQESYAFVRDLILAKRVRAMLGNLLDTTGLKGIARASYELKVPVRALYLSNAESYWDYSDQFRENMNAMNFDDASLIMRTFATKPRNKDYCYSTQPAANFLSWLKQPHIKNIRQIWKDRYVKRNTNQVPFNHIDAKAEESL